MKKFKGIINQVKELVANGETDITPMLWQLICYSPKMPPRLSQQQLLNEAEKFTLSVYDEFFTHANLNFNGFIWGDGSTKVFLTHGWGSKAADFSELITALRKLDNLQITAFDVPGNGSSESELSNLPLYIAAVKAVIAKYGTPDILIGHSLGVMANVITLQETGITPQQLISLTPMVNLKENFKATMNGVGVTKAQQQLFFADFEKVFDDKWDNYNLNNRYKFDKPLKHWLGYDEDDLVAPYPYLKEFLNAHPEITAVAFNGTGHDKILKDEQMIRNVLEVVASRTK